MQIACCYSEAAWKKVWHSRFRAQQRQALDREAEVMPTEREVSNLYDAPKDGKTRYSSGQLAGGWYAKRPWRFWGK